MHLRTIEGILLSNPAIDPNSDVEKEYQKFLRQKDSRLESSGSEGNLIQPKVKKIKGHTKAKLNSKHSTHVTDIEM